MPSLSEEFGRDDRTGRLRRLTVGVAFLVAGLVLTGAGAFDVLSSTLASDGFGGPPEKLAVVVVGLSVPVVLFVLLVLVAPERRHRLLTVTGIILAVVSAMVSWVTLPTNWEGSGLAAPLLTAGLYLLGVTVLLFSVVSAAVTHIIGDTSDQRSPSTTARSTGWRARDSAGPSSVHPADGGSEDDDLSFPLEDDDQSGRR